MTESIEMELDERHPRQNVNIVYKECWCEDRDHYGDDEDYHIAEITGIYHHETVARFHAVKRTVEGNRKHRVLSKPINEYQEGEWTTVRKDRLELLANHEWIIRALSDIDYNIDDIYTAEMCYDEDGAEKRRVIRKLAEEYDVTLDD